MLHHHVTIREEAVRLKTVLRVVADTTPRGARADRTLIMLAYASMGLLFPGSAPTETAQFARCVRLLKQYPWMREKAFGYLQNLTGSAWPYLIARWDEVADALDREINIIKAPEAHAPRTYHMLHEIISRRCDKAFCSHPKEDHVYEHGDFTGRCTVAGCQCGFYRKPH